MKFFKRSVVVLGGLFLLLLLGGIIFMLSFDANQYNALIREQVKQHTGRELTLGEIKPSVFPWLGFEVQAVSLSNAKGFRAKNMLQVKQLDVRVELMPLFKQQVRVDTLRVHGLSLWLEKNKHGKTNWDDLAASSSAVKNNQNKNTENEPAASNNVFANLSINGIEIKEANIDWHDASTKQNVQLQKMNVTTGAIREGEALPISLSVNLQDEKTKSTLNINLKTRVEFDLPAQIFTLPDYALTLVAQGDAIPNKKLTSKLNGDVKINVNKQTLEIEKLIFETLGVTSQSQINITHLLTQPEVNGKMAVNEFNPTKLAKLLAISLPKTRNQTALKKIKMKFDFSANEKSVNIKKLNMILDESELFADVTVNDFAQPKINYALNINQINVDDYLPPKPAAKPMPAATKNTNPKTKVDTPIELPVAMLRDLNLTGEVNIKSLIVSKQKVSALKIKTRAQHGVIEMPLLKANLLDGNIVASASLNVQKKTPRYRAKLNGKNLNSEYLVNPILQDMLGEKSVSLKGATKLMVNITTQGESVNQLLKNSHGKINVNMSRATLHGVDAEYFVRKGVVDYLEKKKQKVPADWRGQYQPKDTTALNVAKASAVIKKGVVSNTDLLLDASRFNITGAGKINLPNETLRYRLVVDVKPTRTKTVGERLLDVPMPVWVTGQFAQPQISIDSKVWLKSVGKELKAEAKKEIKQKVKKEKAKQKARAKKKLDKKLKKTKDKYRKKLKNLFK